MADLPDRVNMNFLFPEPLYGVGFFEKIIQVFSEFGLYPDNWGNEEMEKVPFNIEEIQKMAEKLAGSSYAFVIRKKGGRGYEVLTSALYIQDLNGMYFEFKKPKSQKGYRALYSFFAQLSKILNPEYAMLHPVWYSDDEDAQNFYNMGILHVNEYAKYGPPSIGIYSWIGKRPTQRIGLKNIEESGVQLIEQMESGSILISVLVEPWSKSYRQLETALNNVMSKLSSTGMFGDYREGRIFAEAGKNWQDLPLNAKVREGLLQIIE